MAALNVGNLASTILVQGLVTGDFPKQNLYLLFLLKKQKTGHKKRSERQVYQNINIITNNTSKNKN